MSDSRGRRLWAEGPCPTAVGPKAGALTGDQWALRPYLFGPGESVRGSTMLACDRSGAAKERRADCPATALCRGRIGASCPRVGHQPTARRHRGTAIRIGVGFRHTDMPDPGRTSNSCPHRSVEPAVNRWSPMSSPALTAPSQDAAAGEPAAARHDRPAAEPAEPMAVLLAAADGDPSDAESSATDLVAFCDRELLPYAGAEKPVLQPTARPHKLLRPYAQAPERRPRTEGERQV